MGIDLGTTYMGLELKHPVVASPSPLSATLLAGLEQWMQQKGYDSVRQMRGVMSRRLVADPSDYERANYIKMLEAHKSNPVHA